MIIIFYSLYCGILINIDDIVVCRRTLKTKEFKSLGERDVKCREKCAYEEKMVPACSKWPGASSSLRTPVALTISPSGESLLLE